MTEKHVNKSSGCHTQEWGKRLTRRIVWAMAGAVIIGLLLRYGMASSNFFQNSLIPLLHLLGQLFLRLLQMLVVPLVFVSLVSGVCQLGETAETSPGIESIEETKEKKLGHRLGRMGLKSLLLYVATTALAVSIALFVANSLRVGAGAGLSSSLSSAASTAALPAARGIQQTILSFIPSNPFAALVSGNMMAVIVFALLFGVAIAWCGKSASVVRQIFLQMNDVLMRLVMMVMSVAPLGVFCLLTLTFATTGFGVIKQLALYFLVVFAVLLLQCLGVYSLLLFILARLNPWKFFRKMAGTMLFAFSVSSSTATIPLTLRTLRSRFGVSNRVASLVVPLGATINMDGTAIMQGVATVFIAHAYHLSMTWQDNLTVVMMATLASIGTAGVPGVGLVTLAMVLRQVGLPVEGIGLILGVDRLLDMARTAVNVSGDAMVACIVARSEGEIDDSID